MRHISHCWELWTEEGAEGWSRFCLRGEWSHLEQTRSDLIAGDRTVRVFEVDTFSREFPLDD